jgi:hypothetical protein
VASLQDADALAGEALFSNLLDSDLPDGQALYLGLPSKRLLNPQAHADPPEEPLLNYLTLLGRLASRFRVFLFYAEPGSNYESLAARRLCSEASIGPRTIAPISRRAFRALARSHLPEPLPPWNVWAYSGRYAQFPPPPPRWLHQPLPVVGLSFRARTGHERSGTQFNRLIGPGAAPGCPMCESQDGTLLHILLDCLSLEAEDLRLALAPESPIDDIATLRHLVFRPDFLTRAVDLLSQLGHKW